LADQLGPRARVAHLIGGRTGKLVGGDVADALAAGLDRVHLDLGKLGQDIGRVFQPDPVELQVLTRGEVAVAAVIGARDVRQHAELAGIDRAIGNGNAQHIRMKLEVETVLQPQRLELIVGHLAGDAARNLVAEFLDPRINDRLIILVVAVHQIT
jgi:hypothetical protein